MGAEDLQTKMNSNTERIEAVLAQAQLVNAKKRAIEGTRKDPVCLELSLEHYIYREHYYKLLNYLFQAETTIEERAIVELKDYIKCLLQLMGIIDSCLEERRIYAACSGLKTDALCKELSEVKEYLYFELLVSENTAEYYRSVEESVLRLQTRMKGLQNMVAELLAKPALEKNLSVRLAYLIQSFNAVSSEDELPSGLTLSLDMEQPELQKLLLKHRYCTGLGNAQLLAKMGICTGNQLFKEIYSFCLAKADLLALQGKAAGENLRYLYRQALVPALTELELAQVLNRYFATFFLQEGELFTWFKGFKQGAGVGTKALLPDCEKEILLKGCFELYSNLGGRNDFGEVLLRCIALSVWGEAIKDNLAALFNISQNREKLLEQYLQQCFERYLTVANEFRGLIFDSDNRPEAYCDKLELLLTKNKEENLLEQTDIVYFQKLLTILQTLKKLTSYTSSSHVEEDIKLLLQARRDCEALLEQGLKIPTAFFYANLHRRLLELQGHLNTEIRKAFLYITPRLSCKLKDYEYDATTQTTRLYFGLANAKGMQQAEQLQVIGLEAAGQKCSFIGNLDLQTVSGDGREYEFSLQVEGNLSACTNLSFQLGYSYVCGYQEYEARYVQRQAGFKLNMPQKNCGFREIDNPYAPICTSNAVVDPKMMFGREELLKRLVATVDFTQPKSVVLWGQKRTGKSTVLLHLQNALAAKYTAEELLLTPCDAMSKIDIDSCTEHREVMTEIKKIILKGIRKAVKGNPDLWEALEEADCSLKPIITSKNVNERFEEFFDIYEELEEKPTIVLFIDEFTVLYNWIKQQKLGVSFIKWWREFLSSNKIIAYIVGQDYMQQFIDLDPNGFGNVEKYRVNYLTKEHTLDLIEKPIWLTAEDKSRFLENAAEEIYELTAGSAFYTVLICKHLVDYLNGKEMVYVTDYTINEVMNQLLHGQQALSQDIFESLYNDEGCFEDADHRRHSYELCRIIAQFSSAVKKNVNELEIKRLATERLQLSEQRTALLLEDLTKRDVLNKDGNSYTIKVHLFHEWLKAKG